MIGGWKRAPERDNWLTTTASPPGFFTGVDSKGFKVACFEALL
jgi:hypothetical protein